MVIPVHDINPLRRTPWVTWTLIAINAGVLGAYLALYPRARVWSLVPFLFFIPLRIPAWIVLGLWFVLQWAYAVGGVTGGGAVAYVAHVFGFLAGLVVGLAVRAGSGSRAAA